MHDLYHHRRDHFRPQRNIPAEIARSWLLVNAMKTELFDQSAVSRADAIILDIEDAVDPSQKDAARANVVNWLTAGGSAWVRINDATSPFWADDLAGLRGTPGLLGIMLAKTESADQVTESFHRMDGKTPVIPLVESAVGIEEANNIAKAQGAFRLAFGSGDFRRDTGMAATAEAMAYPRAKLVVASRVGNLPGPIDGPTVGHQPPDPARTDRHHRDDGHDREALPRDRPDPGHQRGHQPHPVRRRLGHGLHGRLRSQRPRHP